MEDFYLQMFKSSPDSLLVYDQKLGLLNANPAALSLLGINNISQVKGKSLLDHPVIKHLYQKQILDKQTLHFTTSVNFNLVTQRKIYDTFKKRGCFPRL
ncbi:MAG: PAS domain-containing protein [Bacteroidales bacterium]|nr:PAS domain-containing protein [Bacteroidales bacterium]